MNTALVLSGGGSRGSFELGALRFLWDQGIRPNIVAGTSVGAVNGVKMAEGELAPNRDPVAELEALWLGLKTNEDMYVEEIWLTKFSNSLVLASIKSDFANPITDAIFTVLIPPFGFFKYASIGEHLQDLQSLVNAFLNSRAMYNLSPIERLLAQQVHADRIARSGIKLRLSVVSLESGNLRCINERGRFVDADREGHLVDLKDGPNDPQVNLVKAVLASAAIPGIFRDVKLDNDHYVDGGVREIVPIRAALEAGADKVYAIVAGKRDVDPSKTSFSKANILDIALRAARDILPNEIQLNETHPYKSWGPEIILIQPTVDVHSSMIIEPGLIRINRDYGYMRAADIIFGADKNTAIVADRIAEARRGVYELEKVFRVLRRGGHRVGGGVATAQLARARLANLPKVQALKQRIKEYVEERRRLGGALPPYVDVAQWWLSFEAHPRDMDRASPWPSPSPKREPDYTPPRDIEPRPPPGRYRP